MPDSYVFGVVYRPAGEMRAGGRCDTQGSSSCWQTIERITPDADCAGYLRIDFDVGAAWSGHESTPIEVDGEQARK